MVSENFIGTSNLIPGSERFHGFLFAKSDALNVMLYVYVHIIGGFLKWWYPQITHFNRVFHYKPSILGYPCFLETPININQCYPKRPCPFIEFIRFTIRYPPSHPISHRLRSGLCSVAHSWNDHLGGATKCWEKCQVFHHLKIANDMKWY